MPPNFCRLPGLLGVLLSNFPGEGGTGQGGGAGDVQHAPAEATRQTQERQIHAAQGALTFMRSLGTLPPAPFYYQAPNFFL